MSQLLIKGGKCANSNCVFDADILIDEGRIVAIGEDLGQSADMVIDAHGKLVLPGGVDIHVHMPWPKGDYISIDDINSGTQAAAFGGVTSIIDFAIPDDEESLESSLEKKVEEANSNSWVDYSFHLNIRGDIRKKINEIPELVRAGFPSFKVFMAYEGFRLDDADLLLIMDAIRQANGMMNVHSENGYLADYLTCQTIAKGDLHPKNYVFVRPAQCEIEANYRLISYIRTLGTKTHIHHVGTMKGAALIADARREGLPLSAETCPQYLLFSNEDYMGDPRKAAYLVCAPSLKSPQDRDGLWRYLSDGSLPVLATDHCPYSKKQKEEHLDDFSKIPGGMGGVATRLPLIFTEGVAKGRISLERFVDMWSTQPAKIFGFYPRKGSIDIGFDADLVIFDPTVKSKIHATDLRMKTDCLPYENWDVLGLPVTTILRGEVLVEQGQLKVDKPGGKLVSRKL